MSTNYQERFWRELDQLKVHVFYLETYLEKTIKIDRAINIALAISSNGSIAGWVIWKRFDFVWACFIAGSQFLNAIKSYLPYAKRLQALRGITNDLESLFLSMENHWFNVAEGRLNQEEIHKLHMKMKEQRRQIIQKHLGSMPLPVDEGLLEKAKQVTRVYFSNFYAVEGATDE